MLQGWDSRLVNECNRVSPIFLGGVDRLDDWWDRVFAQDQIFLPFGVHSTALDDVQANVNDIAVVHWVVCCACVRSTDEEVYCDGLKTIGGMPGGSHFLLICLA